MYCIRFEVSTAPDRAKVPQLTATHAQNHEVRRRYSDFVSLRQALATLHPCYIVPPLPPKNTLSSYAIAGANPAKAREDAALIARRRRMLSTFLNRTLEHPVLGRERVFRRFLDPETPWVDVLHSPPVTLVPKNPLKAPANDPTDADMLALFASLPIPSSSAQLQHPDQRFLDSEAFTNKFSAHLAGSMEKVNRRLMKRWTDAAGDWGEMGGGLNGFALRMGEDGAGGLDEATEKVGMAVDAGYTLTNAMVRRVLPRPASGRSRGAQADFLESSLSAEPLGAGVHRAAAGVHAVLQHHQGPAQVPPQQAPAVRGGARAARVEARAARRARTQRARGPAARTRTRARPYRQR